MCQQWVKDYTYFETEDLAQRQEGLAAARQNVINAARKLTYLWLAEDKMHPQYFAEQNTVIGSQIMDTVQVLDALIVLPIQKNTKELDT